MFTLHYYIGTRWVGTAAPNKQMGAKKVFMGGGQWGPKTPKKMRGKIFKGPPLDFQKMFYVFPDVLKFRRHIQYTVFRLTLINSAGPTVGTGTPSPLTSNCCVMLHAGYRVNLPL